MDSERCEDCGSFYDVTYHIPDEVWALIHERAPAGLLCPFCAHIRARKHGITLWWEAAVNKYPALSCKEVKMNPYKRNGPCPKCGHSGRIGWMPISTRYFILGSARLERLLRGCPNCGYSWMEECLDNDDAKKASREDSDG
jgi:hypothetical protein